MARRLGVWSIQQTAKRLCRLVSKFSPIITSTYSGNDALIAALAAALTACNELSNELELVREYGD